MSKRIVDESFVQEMESNRINENDLEDRFTRLERLIERDEKEILTSPRGRFRSFFKRMLFKLIRPAVQPFIQHQRKLELERLALLKDLWTETTYRLERLDERLLRSYIKTGESMAVLREDLAKITEERLVSLSEDVWTTAVKAVQDESGKHFDFLTAEFKRLGADLIVRADLMIQHLESQIDALQYDLDRHTTVTGKRLELCMTQLDGVQESIGHVRTKTGILARELSSLDGRGETGKSIPQIADTESIDDEFYTAHQDRFRGSSEDIAHRQEIYIEYFRKAAPILDIGCGRGEFLELLGKEGIEAKGIDTNAHTVKACVDKGLDVTESDLFDYLKKTKKGSLGGIFCAQVVEHLSHESLRLFLQYSFKALRKGGVLVAETLNPQSVLALTHYFYLDPTHVTPIPPQLLGFLAETEGFSSVEVKYIAEAPENERLMAVDLETAAPAAIEDAFQRLNRDIDRLNRFLFGHLEYAVIAKK